MCLGCLYACAPCCGKKLQYLPSQVGTPTDAQFKEKGTKYVISTE